MATPEVSDVQLIDGGIGPGGGSRRSVRPPPLWHGHLILHGYNLHTQQIELCQLVM